MGMKLSAEKRLQRAHLQIINHAKFCAIGGVVMFGRTAVDDNVKTAQTNGVTTLYGRAFVDKLTDPQLRFLILHENYHKARRHLTTWTHLYKENPGLANAACDFSINIGLKDLDAGEGFIEMPPNGLIDDKFRGMDEGQIYRELQKQAKGSGGKGSGNGRGQGQGQGGGTGMDEHDWDGASEMSEEQQKQVAAQIDQALRQGAILAGKRGAQMDRSLAGLLEPKINWREVLRDFVTTICSGRDMSTWSRVNRRHVASGIYLPGYVSESVGRVLVGVDTSGSIGMEELREFLTEVVGVAKQVRPQLIDLLYWDSEVAGHEKYSVDDMDTLEHATKPKGGGGTSPSCITAYMAEKQIKPECAIILTDGYVGSDWGGEWPCPVLWCIVGNNVISPIGKTVHVK